MIAYTTAEVSMAFAWWKTDEEVYIPSSYNDDDDNTAGKLTIYSIFHGEDVSKTGNASPW